MTQSETRVPEHLSDIAGQNIETLAAIQKQLLDVLNEANHEWVTFLNEEAELASNLSKKMTTAKSIPDATDAYQELISRQMELITRQARIIFENNQEFMKTCMQVISGARRVRAVDWPRARSSAPARENHSGNAPNSASAASRPVAE
jgi:hypothetical protein